MSYLCYLCLFAYSGVQRIFCCVFLRHVYPMVPVSLDCSFLIVPSVFSSGYVVKVQTFCTVKFYNSKFYDIFSGGLLVPYGIIRQVVGDSAVI